MICTVLKKIKGPSGLFRAYRLDCVIGHPRKIIPIEPHREIPDICNKLISESVKGLREFVDEAKKIPGIRILAISEKLFSITISRESNWEEIEPQALNTLKKAFNFSEVRYA